jgi:hypothetical protein
MSFEQPVVPADAKKRARLMVAGVFVFALAALMFNAGRFAAEGYAAIRFPWELDYGEGIVWEQMRLILLGRGYGSIDGLPAIVFHYPPAFHLVTAAVARITALDPLAAGRSVSIGSTVLIGLFAGLIAAKTVRPDASPRTAWVCGLVAGLAVFCFSPIAFWAQMMRVDMLAVALSFAGLFAAMGALRRPSLIHASTILFVAAVYTKQTSIVAPAAVFVTFLLLRPRLAWTLAAGCVVTGLVVLAALALATDGGFVRHIFLYNANRFDPSRLQAILFAVASHALFATVLCIGVLTRLRARLPVYRGAGSVAVLRQRLIAAPGDAFFLLVLMYAVLASLMSLTVAKSGSNVNYFIEAMAVMAILVGIVARDAVDAAFGVVRARGKNPFADPVLVPLMIGCQALVAGPPAADLEQTSPTRIVALEQLQAMIRSAPRPVISDDMVLLRRSGVPVQWEPAIFAELASTGTWDEAPFVARVKAHHFAFFVTAGQRGERIFDGRYNPAVADAMYKAYPVQRRIAGYTIHLPPTGQAGL